MKICVMCPGSFSHGLNSPERGEGRWAQNYARMLARAGHDVYAASMGLGSEMKTQDGCKLIEEDNVRAYEPYDIYIDSAWWREKIAKGKASKYIILKWSLEPYTREIPLADNFYLGYPYPSHHWEFTKGVNADKTFALPTMFGENFCTPNWDKEKVFLPGKIDTARDYKRYIPAICSFLQNHPIEGCSQEFFKKEFAGLIDFNKPGSNWYDSIPYDQVMAAMSRSKLSLPILNPGCMIEAFFQGIPSVIWENGGFFNELGTMLDILIPGNVDPDRFTEVTNLLMYNKKKYHEVVMTGQNYFIGHTFPGSLGYFDLMVEAIF